MSKNNTRRWPLIILLCLLAIPVAIQATLLLFTGWLNAAPGQRWLQTRLSEATGLHVSLDHFAILGLSHVVAARLEISDVAGVVARADNVKIDVPLADLAARHLALYIHAKRIELIRLPAAKKQIPVKSGPLLAPFALPKMYVRTATVTFAADQLLLDPPVAGRQLTLSPHIKLTADFGGKLLQTHLSAQFAPPSTDDYIPSSVELGASLNPATGVLTVPSAQITAPAYTTNAQGTIALGTQGVSDLHAVINLPALAQKGLAAVTLQLQAEDLARQPHGLLNVSTAYQQKPAELAVNFSGSGGQWSFHNLTGQAPGIKLTGDATLAAGLATGQLDAAFDLSAYRALLGTVDGKGTVHLTLNPHDGKQAATVNAKIQQAQRGTLSLQAADLTAQSDDVQAGQPPPLSLAIRQVQAAGILLKNLKANMTPAGAQIFHLQVTAQGQAHAPFTITAAANVQGGKVWAVRNIDVRLLSRGDTLRLQGVLADGKLLATLRGAGRGITQLAGDLALPWPLSPQAALRGKLAADLQLDSMAQDFLPPDFGLGGKLRAAVTAGGTLGQPQIAGDATLINGSVRQQSTGLLLQNIALQSSFQDKKIKLTSFSAQDGQGGNLTAGGTADLGPGMPLNLQIKANRLNPLRNSNFFTGQLSAALTLNGRQAHYDLKGTVTARPVNITIPDRFGSNIPQLNIVTPNAAKPAVNMLQAIKLAVKIDAPNQVFVRGWGLDAEFGGALDVGGTLVSPDINGTLTSRRGRFEQFGKRFDLSSGTLRFEGATPPSPYLDIAATTTTNGITAEIDLTGPATQPVLKLSSTPALPQDEVLSHILFGKDMSSISPFQAVEIAQTLQQFSGHGGGGGIDPLAKLRGAAGLDDLSVNSSDTGPTTVGAGKYLTDRVYLSVQGGADQKSSAAQVQVDLTPHVKATSKIGADAQTGGGLLWQWDY